MSLYFADRVEECVEDRKNDKIVFTFPWMYALNGPVNMDEGSSVGDSITTSYKMARTRWDVYFRDSNETIVLQNASLDGWNGRCFISYTVYYDTEMRFVLYSSTRVEMIATFITFHTPEGFMSRFVEAMEKRNLSKIVLFIEFHLPLKNFYQPSSERESLWDDEKEKEYDEIPNNFENDARLEFMNKSDYTFECLDGTVAAQQVILFTSSATMRKQLLSHSQNEGIVKYTVAVVKPIIVFFHSLWFKLPETYDLEYANQILSAMEFFVPFRKDVLREKLSKSICHQFAKAKYLQMNRKTVN
uniref:Uncharacterized protein n=1 Tax=Panagrolaimus sp. ES5 TaxID=591445 RepID=A0AC34FLY3_9BILA